MAREDWGSWLAQFATDWEKTQIPPEEWCAHKELKWSTAKKYITIKAAKEWLKNRESEIANTEEIANKIANSRNVNANRKRQEAVEPSAGKGSEDDAHVTRSPLACGTSETKPVRDNAHAPFGINNTAALKHGGYSRRRLLADDVIEDAQALRLEDELVRIKAASLTATANAGRWEEELRNTADPEEVKSLEAKISAADNALDRNAARIESITRTLDQMMINKAMRPKIEADTEYRIAATEKARLEAENLRNGGGKNQQIIVHNSLIPPGSK